MVDPKPSTWDPQSSFGHAAPELALVEALDWFGPAFSRWVAAQTPDGSATTYPRLRVLRVLARRGPQRPAQVAAELAATKATMTGLIDALVASQLIIRASDPSDGRATLLKLTVAGEHAAADQSAVLAAAHVLDGLDRSEVLQLLETIKTLGDRLRRASLEDKRESRDACASTPTQDITSMT